MFHPACLRVDSGADGLSAPSAGWWVDAGFNPLLWSRAFYPVCWVYNRVPGYEFVELTGTPVFLQAGAADQYDDPDSCQKLVDSLSAADRPHLSLTVYPEATHGWDRLEPAIQVTDPYSHTGKGGLVDIAPSPETARTSRRAVVDFFKKAFAPAP